MVEFRLSEEQRGLQRLAREFVEREVKPWAARGDQVPDPAENFNWEIIEKASRLGLRTLAVPKRFGGGGADILTVCIVGEELAVGDLGIAVSFDQTWKYTYILTDVVNEDQRGRYLPRFMEDHRYLLAIAFTEPDYGSDTFGIEYGPHLGMRMDARKEGDVWVLNGTKHFISNGGLAKLYFICTRTDKTVGLDRGCSTFLVPAGAPGFIIGKVHDKLGQRNVQNAELVFRDCRIPERDLIGGVNQGLRFQKELARASHVEAAATVLGPARRAYEETLEYAKNRVQGGKPIVEHQAVGLMLSEMCMLLDAARSYVWRTAWKNEYEEPFEPHYSMLTKVFAAEAAVRVCTLAIEIWGGMGYMKEAPVEKCLRDALSFLHSDGANQVHLIKASQYLGGLAHWA
ncbi:MAG: acyl-CoA dehydrogenase family protein [Nitrospinota bacterium]